MLLIFPKAIFPEINGYRIRAAATARLLAARYNCQAILVVMLGEQVIDWVKAVIHPDKSMSENLWAAYEALLTKNVVEAREMVTLRAWLDDLARLGF